MPQAMAAGKPVVAYDCDGAKEVCLDRKTGLLIKPGDRKMTFSQYKRRIHEVIMSLRSQQGVTVSHRRASSSSSEYYTVKGCGWCETIRVSSFLGIKI